MKLTIIKKLSDKELDNLSYREVFILSFKNFIMTGGIALGIAMFMLLIKLILMFE